MGTKLYFGCIVVFLALQMYCWFMTISVFATSSALFSFFNALPNLAEDIIINLNLPAKEILERSLDVMSTVGEWQLMNITAHKGVHNASIIDELIFHVSL